MISIEYIKLPSSLTYHALLIFHEHTKFIFLISNIPHLYCKHLCGFDSKAFDMTTTIFIFGCVIVPTPFDIYT